MGKIPKHALFLLLAGALGLCVRWENVLAGQRGEVWQEPGPQAAGLCRGKCTEHIWGGEKDSDPVLPLLSGLGEAHAVLVSISCWLLAGWGWAGRVIRVFLPHPSSNTTPFPNGSCLPRPPLGSIAPQAWAGGPSCTEESLQTSWEGPCLMF